MKIKFSFDDGAQDDLRVAELLLRYEQDAIFYIPSQWQLYNAIEGREPLSDIEFDYIAENFEIGSHTVTHRLLTRIPLTEAEREIAQSKYDLQARCGQPITSFCYPRGYANDDIRHIVRQYYQTARNTLINNYGDNPDSAWQSTTVHVAGKRRKEYEHTTWLSEACKTLETAIAQAAAGKEVVWHAWGHSWEISRYDGWHDFEGLLKTVAEL